MFGNFFLNVKFWAIFDIQIAMFLKVRHRTATTVQNQSTEMLQMIVATWRKICSRQVILRNKKVIM